MSASGVSTFDLVIADGLVADGGSEPHPADIGILGDRVTAIGDLRLATRGSTLTARGLVVAPGFIDIHSHSDISLLADPRAESGLLQGVTTEIVGNCGHGPAPIADTPAFRANLYGALPHLALDWADFEGYFDRLTATGPAVNIACLVPNGSLRLAAMGSPTRQSTISEQRVMVDLLETALDAGAIGLSTGLEYPLEASTTNDELETLCRSVARHGGLHACHTRARGTGVIDATSEAIDVGRATGVRTQIAHALPRIEAPHGTLEELVVTLGSEATRVDLGWDMHTRTFAGAGLGSVLPAAALASGAGRRGIVEASRTSIAAGEGLLASFARGGWDRVSLVGPGWSASVDGAGRDPLETLADAWLDHAPDRDALMVHARTYDEDGIAAIITAPGGMPASDSASQSRGGPYEGVVLEGAFSWAAWTLRRLVRERRQLSLGEAIARLSALPASRAGLSDRGRLAIGMAADVVVFDPTQVAERATQARPMDPAVGFRYVLVNGRLAVADGRLTGVRAGAVLRA